MVDGEGLSEAPRGGSALPGVLAVVGVLDIIGGLVVCTQLWPGKPDAGYEWLISAYIPALTWLGAGFVSGLFCFAAAAALQCLRDIRSCARAMEDRLALLSTAETGYPRNPHYAEPNTHDSTASRVLSLGEAISALESMGFSVLNRHDGRWEISRGGQAPLVFDTGRQLRDFAERQRESQL
jgi:hypothetical protein